MSMQELEERLRDFPLFRCWCHRDLYRGHGWSFGFYLAPWPREEHCEGGMVRALVMMDGFVSRKGASRIWWWFADPADRQLAKPQRNPSND